MSMLHLLLSGCLFVAFAAAGETVKPELKPAKLTPAARIEGKMLTIDVPAGREGLENYAEFTLDLGQYASCHLIGTIRGKFTGFRPDQDRRKGIDLRLSYRADDDSHDRLGGGFFRNESLKNGTLQFGFTLDPYARQCKMRISLNNCSGKAEFDLASLEFTPLFTPPKEEYVCEYSDAVKARPVHRGVMSPIRNQTDEEDFRELRRWNVNLMRLQLNTSEQWARSEPAKYRAFIRDKIDNVIPKALDLGQKYGIKIIIDLHTASGSNRMTDNPDFNGLYDNDDAVKEYLAIWEEIAEKFHRHPALYGYDLMNEPKQHRPAKYNYRDLQYEAAKRIRAIDPETPIYVESNMMCSPLSFYYLEPLKLRNIIYQVHFYEPFDYTHHFIRKAADRKAGRVKVNTFPGDYYGTHWSGDLVQIRKKLTYVRAFEQRFKAKIYVGEFSAPAYAPGAEQYLASCIKVFEEYGWDWTYHAFRESKGWDVEYAGTADDDLVRVPTTPRREVLLNAFKKNRKE